MVVSSGAISLLEKPRTPLSVYCNALVHVPQCLQKFDGVKVCPFHIDSLWLTVPSQGCRPCPSSSLGRHHSQNNLSQSHWDASRCDNGYKRPSCAGKDQEKSAKREGERVLSLPVDVPTLHPLQPSGSYQSASRGRRQSNVASRTCQCAPSLPGVKMCLETTG